ncbi:MULTISPECIES: MarR family winged helix-turn-helix transcriptional regulator [Paenibacillus]|uniref:MarR family winged helix-turn-helix transcriptional regulator n=1 Tax=Paenibacillus TaxID=44249 RepID=UPI0022B936D7|nr:MarR family transcriptional regulator [Paenibacillus caseinilyticus]MCZ8521245.1 MarR family transcriptional regulator [Paenibacillus caseinilyticus]
MHPPNDHVFCLLEREIAVFVRRAEAARIALLKDHQMDRSTYLLLQELSGRGPLGIKALAEALLLDISTASRQTAALEEKGYVERITDPRDARYKLLRITEEGRVQLGGMGRTRAAFYAGLLKEWPEEEARALGELIAKFNRTTGKYIAGYRAAEET